MDLTADDISTQPKGFGMVMGKSIGALAVQRHQLNGQSGHSC
jgi:hypothetical protein